MLGHLKEKGHHIHVRDVVQCATEQLMKSELICFIEGFLIVLSKGKEKKKDSFEGISECVGNEEATGDHDCMRDLALSLIRSTIHGNIMGSTGDEEPNERAKTFHKLLSEAQRKLYLGCKSATKVSFIVRLFHIQWRRA